MMDHLLQYSNLKNNVLKEAGTSVSIEQLKEHFSTSINSRRALSRVKSLKCIIQLLEEREMLNWKNVECLKQIGDLLQNNEIGELVQCYKKLEDIEEKLCICGEPIQQDENQCLIENNNNVVINLVNPVLHEDLNDSKLPPPLPKKNMFVILYVFH
ncbi:unnamed protein product [Larinioides sclopetarius]|uniref:Uncharacterized protein n=1 Tax=Larinioides sclopetarius TaxID=280406 RepID=A0AAV1Z9V0_9ARAC